MTKQNTLSELAQPYYVKSGNNPTKSLIILVHGFGASATETRPIASYLQNCGYDSTGILLTGHGSNPCNLLSVKWNDWFLDIKQTYHKYSSSYDNIFIGGVSLGGSLSLYSATKMDFAGVFTINALYKFSLFQRLVLPIFSCFKITLKRSEERIKWYEENKLFSYPVDVLPAAYQVSKFLNFLHREMANIDIPTLIIQSKTDKTISPLSGDWIYSCLKNNKKKLVRISEGDHILTVDPNKDIAFEAINIFLTNVLSK